MQPFDESAPSLSDTLTILRRRWVVIAVAILVVTAGALGWAEFVKSNAVVDYRATHKLAPTPSRTLSPMALEQMAVVVNEGEVRDIAQQEFGGLAGTTVQATADETAGTLNISARGPVSDAVNASADGYADALVKYLADQDRAEHEIRVFEQSGRVQAASEALAAAQAAVDADPSNPQLLTDRDTALTAYQSALSLLQSTQVEQLPDPQFRTLSRARATEAPLGGFPGLGLGRELGIALILGTLLGIGCAYVVEALDRRLVTAEAAAKAFGMPVIAEIPDGGKEFATGDHLAPPASLVNEAYRRLRTIVQLEMGGRASGDPAVVVLVASPGPREGKTTTVAHLARALGEVGQRVLLVSADFRRPQLHHYFGVEPTRGIAALADRGNGSVAAKDLTQETLVPGVALITAGSGLLDPTELIHHARRFVSEARQFYDYVIIDTPPLMSASDALNFVPQSDVVVLVSRFNETKKPWAERTRDMLLRIDAPVLGVVMTAIKGGEGYGYYYYGQTALEPRGTRPGVEPRSPTKS